MSTMTSPSTTTSPGSGRAASTDSAGTDSAPDDGASPPGAASVQSGGPLLAEARAVTERLLPGLDKALATEGRTALESPGSPGLGHFLNSSGVGLLAAREAGGLGATAAQAIAVQAAIGARSGSLAVATTMHHFSLASLRALASVSGTGLEAVLIQAVAEQGHLLASGFAEGRPDRGIVSPTMTARAGEDGVRVSGVKRPCSLSASMTMLTASVTVQEADGGEHVAVVLVPADADGVRVEPFWASPVLGGAESDAVWLEDVFVPEALVVHTDLRPGGALDHVHRVGFCWFELLMTASYWGVAASLVEEASERVPAAAATLAADVAALESTWLALSSLAGVIDDAAQASGGAVENGTETVSPAADDRVLAQLLTVRFALQDLFPGLSGRVLEVLGGIAFITDPALATRLSTLHALAFHPPSRRRCAGGLAAALTGAPLNFD